MDPSVKLALVFAASYIQFVWYWIGLAIKTLSTSDEDKRLKRQRMKYEKNYQPYWGEED
jgi:hypothetical protein